MKITRTFVDTSGHEEGPTEEFDRMIADALEVIFDEHGFNPTKIIVVDEDGDEGVYRCGDSPTVAVNLTREQVRHICDRANETSVLDLFADVHANFDDLIFEQG